MWYKEVNDTWLKNVGYKNTYMWLYKYIYVNIKFT